MKECERHRKWVERKERDALLSSVMQERACALVLDAAVAHSSLSRLVSRSEEGAAAFFIVPLSLCVCSLLILYSSYLRLTSPTLDHSVCSFV